MNPGLVRNGQISRLMKTVLGKKVNTEEDPDKKRMRRKRQLFSLAWL